MVDERSEEIVGLSAKEQNQQVEGRSRSGLGCLHHSHSFCLTDQPAQSINGNTDYLTDGGGLLAH